jgi:hypothetical protein
MIDNPFLTMFTVGVAKLTGFFFEKYQWIQKGIDLATGFKMGTAGSGGFLNALKAVFSPGGAISTVLTPLVSAIGVLAAGFAGGLIGKSIGGVASEAVGNKSTDAGDNWGTATAIAGGLIGLALAPFTAGSSLAITAAAVGGGALAGGAIGKFAGDAINQPVKDGLFGGERGIAQGGKITPIDNKDDLLAMKPGGVVDKHMFNNSNSSSMKIEFGEIQFKFDELKVTSPGSPGVAIDLLKDPQFIRNLTNLIHTETEMAIQGGKTRKK